MKDVDVNNTAVDVNNTANVVLDIVNSIMPNVGRTKISANISYKDFKNNPLVGIMNTLEDALNTHNNNVTSIQELKRYYKGKQNVLITKQRATKNSINNKIVVNHSFVQVEFKKGFMVGKPIEYANNSSQSTNDLDYINRWFTDSNKAGLDINKYEDLYVSGIAYQMIIPKRYDYNIDNESPYELYNLDNEKTFCVYSNEISSIMLYAVVISNDSDGKEYYNCYCDGMIYQLKYSDNLTSDYKYVVMNRTEMSDGTTIYGEAQPSKGIPIIEYTLNQSRMGIVEVGKPIQDAINLLISNEFDDVEEFVNAYLVFENQNPEKVYENANKVKEERVIAITTVNPQNPAKVYLLKQSLDYSQLNILYEQLLTALYDLVGVPRSSGNVTSGGDTGEARLLGNGWEAAQNRANIDVTYLTHFEYELLKKIINIANEALNNPLTGLLSSQISIKYSINMSNNLLVKTQSLSNLYAMKFPKEQALNIVGLTSDSHDIANKWETKENEDNDKRVDTTIQKDL